MYDSQGDCIVRTMKCISYVYVGAMIYRIAALANLGIMSH